MAKGMLIDTTRCTGCRGCQSACKQWNLLAGVHTSFSPTMTNPPELSEYNYNHVEYYELADDDGNVSWQFKHWRCLHCLEPVCVVTCPIGAIIKLSDGSVVVDRDICDALQYCGCPFNLITFGEGGKAFKCTFCWNRTKDGLEPACAKTCPTNTIQYGDRDELLTEAKTRIQQNPDKYYDHVYGESEVGGTRIMYLTAVAPEKMGFPSSFPEFVIPEEEAAVTTKISWGIPAAITAAIATIAGLLIFRSKRAKSKSA